MVRGFVIIGTTAANTDRRTSLQAVPLASHSVDLRETPSIEETATGIEVESETMFIRNLIEELSGKERQHEVMLGRILKRMCKLNPAFALVGIDVVHRYDSERISLLGIQSEDEILGLRFRIRIVYTSEENLLVKFRFWDGLGVERFNEMTRISLRKPMGEEQLLKKVDRMLASIRFSDRPDESQELITGELEKMFAV